MLRGQFVVGGAVVGGALVVGASVVSDRTLVGVFVWVVEARWRVVDWVVVEESAVEDSIDAAMVIVVFGNPVMFMIFELVLQAL